MADNTGALLASLLLGQRRRVDPFDVQRTYGQGLIVKGSSTAPLGSGSPLEGLARALQGGIGGLTVGLANAQERNEEAQNIGAMQAGLAAKTPEEFAAATKGLKGPNAEALLASLLQNKQTELQQGVAAQRFGAGYGATGPGNSGTSITITRPNLSDNSGDYQKTLATRESGGNPTAVNPQSGAFGLFQFMPETASAVRQANPQLNLPEDHRTWTPDQQSQAEQALRGMNDARLKQLGIPVTPQTLALAHATGADGTAKLLSTPPDTPMEQVVPKIWIDQNPPMRGKTVGQYVAQFSQFGQPNQAQNQPQAPQVLPQGTQTAQNGPLVPPMGEVEKPRPTPEMIQRAMARINAGADRHQVEADLEKELLAQQQANREQRRIEYTQGLEQGRLTQRPMAEQVVKHIGVAQDLGQQARGSIATMNQLDQLGKVINAGGPLAPTTIALKNWAKGIGVNLEALGIADNVAPAQAYDAIVKQFALQMRNPAQGGGLPGSVSNYEDKLLQSMTPTLLMTPEGRAQLIDYQKRMAQRNIELSDLASRFSESPEFKNNPQALYRHISDYVNAHPLFTADELKGGTPPPQTAPQAGNVPQAAIDYLKSNPGLAGAFDQKYGQGSAARILGH